MGFMDRAKIAAVEKLASDKQVEEIEKTRALIGDEATAKVISSPKVQKFFSGLQGAVGAPNEAQTKLRQNLMNEIKAKPELIDKLEETLNPELEANLLKLYKENPAGLDARIKEITQNPGNIVAVVNNILNPTVVVAAAPPPAAPDNTGEKVLLAVSPGAYGIKKAVDDVREGNVKDIVLAGVAPGAWFVKKVWNTFNP